MNKATNHNKPPLVPGSFHLALDPKTTKEKGHKHNEETKRPIEIHKIQLESDQGLEPSTVLNTAITKFLEEKKLSNKALTVYYPGCGIQLIPNELFEKGSRIIYVDPYADAINKLKLHSDDSFISKAQDFDLKENGFEQADLVVYLNPNGFRYTDIENQIKPGGYLVCSNGWIPEAGRIANAPNSSLKLDCIIASPNKGANSSPQIFSPDKVTWTEYDLIGTQSFKDEISVPIDDSTLYYVFKRA